MSRHPSPDAAAWCASRPISRPACSSPVLESPVWPSRLRAVDDRSHHQRHLSRRRWNQRLPARAMNAEIIAIGSEMLTPQRVDTNSLYLTAELNNLGVEVVSKCVIGDDRLRLADAVRARHVAHGNRDPLGRPRPHRRRRHPRGRGRSAGPQAGIPRRYRQRPGAPLRAVPAQNGGDQQAPGIRHRGRARAAQRSRHGARPVGGGSPIRWRCFCLARPTN